MKPRTTTGSHKIALATLAAVTGIGLLAGSKFADANQLAWLAGTLANVGASFLLFTPLYLLTKRLDEQVTEVNKQTRQELTSINQKLTDTNEIVESSQAKLETIEQNLDGRLSDFRRKFDELLRERHAKSREAIDKIRSAPDLPDFEAFLDTALTENWFSRQTPSPRVPIGHQGAKLELTWHEFMDQFESIEFRVIDSAGNVREHIPWTPTSPSFLSLAMELERACEPLIGKPRLATEDPANWIARFADLAELARQNPQLKPFVEYCPPQWAITQDGVHALDKDYEIASDRVHEMDWVAHLERKPWTDRDSLVDALDSAQTIWPQKSPWRNEPPF